MVGRMIGRKTVPASTSINHQTYILKKIRIIAWPKPLKYLFKQISARHVAKRDGAKKKYTPPPTTIFEICGYKHKQEQIKRCPEVSNAQIRQYTVKK